LSLLYLAALDLPPYLEVSLKFHEFGFHVLRRLNFATIAGLFPLTNPGLELLLALKPPPPTFGVILLDSGTQEVSGYSV
jgi:hypothetical protein